MSRTALGATASLRMAAHAAAPARGAHRVPSARSRHPLRVCAMVNVDFASPSLVLGTALIGCGIVLLQARNMRQRVSRDADIVVAAMISIVGSTLIFQGWRLDPLLLLCQVRACVESIGWATCTHLHSLHCSEMIMLRGCGCKAATACCPCHCASQSTR